MAILASLSIINDWHWLASDLGWRDATFLFLLSTAHWQLVSAALSIECGDAWADSLHADLDDYRNEVAELRRQGKRLGGENNKP